MRKISASIAVALAIVFGSAVTFETPGNQPQADSPDTIAICERLRLNGATPVQMAQQDCCSGHGGVCGCQYGQVLCCDGQYSQTCGC